MIKVYVREKDEVDGAALDAELRKRRKQIRNGMRGAGVHERGTPSLLDDMHGRKPRTNILGIDGSDAMWVAGEARLQHVKNTL
jgi:hypothetical protein